jgi:hypothetical protein
MIDSNIEILETPLQATVRNRYGTNFEEVWLVEKVVSKTTGVWYKSNLTVKYLYDTVDVWFKESELEFED